MTYAQHAPRPEVLSTFDMPDAHELMLHGCEDCACPVTDDCDQRAKALPELDAADPRRWVRAEHVVEMPLDQDHRLLFNPAGRGGVAVVNQTAQRIFRSLGSATTISDVRSAWPEAADDIARIFSQLSRLDVIHQADQPPRQEFGPGRVLTAWLHVSNACNLRCPYCYVSKTTEGMDESVGLAAVDAVVSSALAHGFPAVKLKYAGGEASLNHRLVLRVQEHAREITARHGLQLFGTLLSNGVSLPRHLVKSLMAEDIRIMISLDGIGEM